MSPRPRATSVPLVLAAVLAGGCLPDEGRPDLEARAFLEVVAAEDARPAGGARLETLRAATRTADPFLRRAGVRALGRLERPELVGDIVPLLGDPDADVRAEAANALAQAVHRGGGAPALGPLLRAARDEPAPQVQAALARALGRLAVADDARPEVERALVALSRGVSQPRDDGVVLGATLGMESLVRREGPRVGAVLTARVEQLVAYRGDDADQAARVRALAIAMAARIGRMTPDAGGRALADPNEGVRTAAAAALGALDDSARVPLVALALSDPSARVRTEAVRLLAGATPDRGACVALVEAAADPDARVGTLAVDALARPCPDGTPAVELLDRLAGALPGVSRTDWHLGAHALVSLTTAAPTRARAHLPAAATHANPFVRAYAARAAGALGDVPSLRRLLADEDSNVLSQASLALAATAGASADPELIGLMGRTDDAQVVVTVAPLLHETGLKAPTAEAALATLDRLSEPHQQTLRDPRLALLDLLGTVGDVASLRRVEPYLRDYDRAVAERAASVMERWTGKAYLGAPRSVVRLPLPGAAELREMERSAVVLHMARGGAIEIALFPLEAPTNAWRLYEMAREGTLDGLTFHRVVPNFVIQGGSPRANEYAGHGAYTRDEVGLRPQWRGTVGVSTRGRDTGDGQIYVNLADNVRLDHDYTLLGEVVSGMDVVDAVLEGDVIARVEVRRR
ncbi:MAG TPA: HEAT repeat domain-containing protein [Longimicrobiales bacterium]|nr:HEAT repeat domain-containing protein [Longimicrobiales bacterium]